MIVERCDRRWPRRSRRGWIPWAAIGFPRRSSSRWWPEPCWSAWSSPFRSG